MDNKLVIQLLKSKTEEIQRLLEHFASKPADLNDGIELLDSRIQNLSHDFNILKKNCSFLQDETPLSNVTEEIIPAFPESIVEKTEPSTVISENEIIIENVVQEKIEANKETESSIINESVPSETIQLIGEKQFSQQLTDIQSAIGINDRFLFTRELFQNNIDEYNTAISFVNKTDKFESVMNWIKAEKKWDLEDPTVVQFIEITKRKF